MLWNALILHARWGGMIKERGMAVLAVLGNVVTAWSWFGVNELGVGLHSYGFTEGRLMTLALVMLAHLVMVLSAGCPPRFGGVIQPASRLGALDLKEPSGGRSMTRRLLLLLAGVAVLAAIAREQPIAAGTVARLGFR